LQHGTAQRHCGQACAAFIPSCLPWTWCHPDRARPCATASPKGRTVKGQQLLEMVDALAVKKGSSVGSGHLPAHAADRRMQRLHQHGCQGLLWNSTAVTHFSQIALCFVSDDSFSIDCSLTRINKKFFPSYPHCRRAPRHYAPAHVGATLH
jgi:hypothetical protein